MAVQVGTPVTVSNTGAAAVSSLSGTVDVALQPANRHILGKLFLASASVATPTAPTMTINGVNVPLEQSVRKTVGGFNIAMYVFSLPAPPTGVGLAWSVQNFGGSFTYASATIIPSGNALQVNTLTNRVGDAEVPAPIGAGLVAPSFAVLQQGNSISNGVLLVGSAGKVHTTNSPFGTTVKTEPNFCGGTGVTSAAGSATSAASATPPNPPKVLGSLVLCVLRHRNTGTTSCATTGWTKLGQITTTNFSLSIFWAIENNVLAAPTITWATASVWQAEMYRYAFCDTAPALLGSMTAGLTTALTNAGGNTTKSQATVITIVATNLDTASLGTTPSGYALRADSKTITSGALGHFGLYDKKAVGSTGTASGTFSMTLGAAAAWACAQIELGRQSSSTSTLIASASGIGSDTLGSTAIWSQLSNSGIPTQHTVIDLDSSAGHTDAAKAAVWYSVGIQNLDAKVVQAPTFTNTQTFYAPTVTQAAAAIKPPLHTNVQTFYAPKISTTVKATLAVNAQEFYGPTVRTGIVQTARFDNAQAFYTPKVKATYKVGARFDNQQTFYAPVVFQSGGGIRPPMYQNTQVFYAPTITRLQRVAASLFTNLQVIYAPRVSISAPAIHAPLHVNQQEFYAPKLNLTLHVGGGSWDVTGSWSFDIGGTGANPAVLVQDAAGNLTGNVNTVWVITSGTVVGNAIEFFTAGPGVGTVSHVVGTIAPDGTISGTWHDNYPPPSGSRDFTVTTISGVASGAAGGAFVNRQEFYPPSVALAQPRTVFPTLHVNQQQFFAPRVLFFRPTPPIEPPHGAPTIGAGWWEEATKHHRKRRKQYEETVWKIPSAADIPDRSPPWTPTVVTVATAKARVAKIKAIDGYMRNLDAKRARARREQQIEDTIIQTVVNILKEE